MNKRKVKLEGGPWDGKIIGLHDTTCTGIFTLGQWKGRYVRKYVCRFTMGRVDLDPSRVLCWENHAV